MGEERKSCWGGGGVGKDAANVVKKGRRWLILK